MAELFVMLSFLRKYETCFSLAVHLNSAKCEEWARLEGVTEEDQVNWCHTLRFRCLVYLYPGQELRGGKLKCARNAETNSKSISSCWSVFKFCQAKTVSSTAQ